MRVSRVLIAVVALFAPLLPTGCLVSVRHPADPAPPPAITAFDAALAPYGEFIVVARVGRVWRPHLSVVGAGFVPYLSGGRWVYTPAGWVFQSRWDFGWAVFHYGHWMDVPPVGWVWLPGDEWATAWVDWQVGGGYVAWAPAPPPLMAIDWRPRWCFVEARTFATEDQVERFVLPPGAVHRASPALTPVHRVPGHPVAVGPPPEYIERNAGVPVRIHEVTAPPPRGIGRVKVHDWSPPPGVPVPPPPPAKPAPPAVIPAPPARPPVAPPAAPREGPPPAVKPPPPAQPAPPPGHHEPRDKDRDRKDRQPGVSRATAWKHAVG